MASARTPKTPKTATPKTAPKKASAKKAAPTKRTKTTKLVSSLAPKKRTTPRGVTLISSEVVYKGPLFEVHKDMIREPEGTDSRRDVIRHNGSVVILAIDPAGKPKNPFVVMERQYRHAAGQYLWELPAGKLDGDEKHVDGAKRELIEETGYRAKKWTPLVRYFASPGFLGEWMQIFLAEGLSAGDAAPEEDEHIELRLVRLSELLALVDQGKILDGKTLIATLLLARRLGLRR